MNDMEYATMTDFKGKFSFIAARGIVCVKTAPNL